MMLISKAAAKVLPFFFPAKWICKKITFFVKIAKICYLCAFYVGLIEEA